MAASADLSAEGSGIVVLRDGRRIRVDLDLILAAFHVMLEADMDGTDEFVLIVLKSGEAIVLPAEAVKVFELIGLLERLMGRLRECSDAIAGSSAIGATVECFGELAPGVAVEFVAVNVGGWMGRLFGAKSLIVRSRVMGSRE